MDRLATLFEQLPLPEVARLLRRSAISALLLGVVGLVVAVLLDHPLAGLGLCLGLGLGLGNIRLVTATVARVNSAHPEHPKRVLASRSLVRLSLTTIIVVGLLFASVQLGLCAAGGTALFYFLLVANLVRSILQQGTAGVET